MSISLRDLNEKRKEGYYKNREEEDFLTEMNKVLQQREKALYGDYEIEHPLIFVFGLPRSGTTLMAQLLAYTLDAGYINNLIARFWLAPLHGIRLSQSMLGQAEKRSYRSEYARTSGVADLHEFGYFWRYWLKKETIAGSVNAKSIEKDIDWEGLKKTLANMQREFHKPMVFKNMFGAHHLGKLKEALKKVLYVYIERDPLDVAVSILDARRKHYDDLNNWWSNIPPEYDQLKDRDYWEQIAGQVFFLNRFYSNEIDRDAPDHTLTVAYEEVCTNPSAILIQIQNLCRKRFHCELNQINEPPPSFPFRTYEDRKEEKDRFQSLIKAFGKRHAQI